MSAVGTKQFSIVSTTFPNITQARILSAKILKLKLCACAQIIPKLESHYWWKGKLCKSSEVWLLLKTHRSKIRKLINVIDEHHPYDVPEIIEIPITSGSVDYLDWMKNVLDF